MPRPKNPANQAPKAIAKRGKSSDAKRGAAVRGAPETTTMAAAAAVSPDKPLTEQQKAFAIAWAKGDTIPNAMARAGYNEQPSYGYRMAKMPNVLRLYNAEKAKYEEAAQMSRKKVMDMLIESYEMAKLMAEPATMVSAAREVGKMCGYFTVQHKVEVNVNQNIAMGRMNALSDEELIKLIESGGAEGVQSALLPAPDDITEAQEVETDDPRN